MKNSVLALVLLLPACVTTSGNYQLAAYDADGKLLTGNLNLIAQGSGIYTARNALCQTYPKANIVIKDINSGSELKSESPYKCK